MLSSLLPLTIGRMRKLFVDLTHLGRHVTGLERISIDLFEKASFDGFTVVPVRSRGQIGMIVMQQIWLPLLAVLNPHAMFAFPGFPPSPLFALARSRTVLYVHDLFLITRKADLSLKARLYMRWPFAFAIRHLQHFLVNSEKTAAELRAHCPASANIVLYRPDVKNVFGLETRSSAHALSPDRPLRMVTLGTVEPRKNYRAAIAIRDALERLGHTKAELHIIGRPGWGDDAEALARAPGVVMRGYLSLTEAKAAIETADLYLCTSHDEGLGLPLLEVQYSGIPVVAPDAPVFHEVLGQSAIFIDPAQPEAAAQRIDQVLRGKAEAGSIAAAANLERWSGLAHGDRRAVANMFRSLADAG
jgi:glycosyltransferase involved in cell wall biosynthesis